MENKWSIKPKTRDSLKAQVDQFGQDLYPPTKGKEDILTKSEGDLKAKYPRRYEIYKRLLASQHNQTNIPPEELVRMKKWLTALNSLDTYITNHNKDIVDSGLWEKQFTVFEDIREFLEKGGDSGYIKLPTRFGKTVIFTKLIEALSMRTVVVVPTQSLVDQTEAKIAEFSNNLSIGKVYARSKEFGKDVTVTTYASLVSMVNNGQIKPEEVGCLILDEVHRGLSEMRSDTINKFEQSLKIGFSATPSFSEEKGADKLLKNEIHSLTLAEASAEGLISPFKVIVAETGIDISQVKVLSTGDYSLNELSRAVNLESRNRAAVELYQKMFSAEKVIAYCVDIKHAEDFNEECKKAGIKSVVVSSAHKETNQKNIDDYLSGKTNMLVNVDILTEGFDAPETSVCLNLRPTFSRVIAEQRSGRVLTLDPNNPNKHAYIVEFVDQGSFKRSARPITFYDVIGMTESYLSTKSGSAPNSQVKKLEVPKIDNLKIHTDAKDIIKILNKTKVKESTYNPSKALQEDYMDPERYISLNNIDPNELKNVAISLEQDLELRLLTERDPYEYKELQRTLLETFTTLPPREAKVIKMRFFDYMTLEEVGAHMGVSKNRIRQIEEKALRYLRHPSRSRTLEDYWPGQTQRREKRERIERERAEKERKEREERSKKLMGLE